jgi:hypothetical protein
VEAVSIENVRMGVMPALQPDGQPMKVLVLDDVRILDGQEILLKRWTIPMGMDSAIKIGKALRDEDIVIESPSIILPGQRQ